MCVRWHPCQHIPASVSESSASLVAVCWEKLLPLLSWCSVSNPPLSLVSFRTPCSWDILRGRSIATRDTCSNENWSADEISIESQRQNRFWKSSPQRKPDALKTSAPWQLKCFEIARRALKVKLLKSAVPLTAVLQNRQVFLPDPLCS